MFKEFKTFINRGNVVDMAVGIIIGAAFTSIVKSLVDDLLMPIIGMLTGGLDFSNFFITLSGDHFDTLAAAKEAGAVTINYGIFLGAALNFVIVAFAVFILVKNINRFREQEEKAPAALPRNEVLLEEIRDLLKQQVE